MTIEICDISKSIGNKPILNRVNLSIQAGKVTILLGANGAGKSSLMRAALGIDLIDSGVVKIFNTLIGDINPIERAKKIGYLSQNAIPEWNMRTQDLIELGRIPLQELGQTNPKADIIAVKSAMDRLGITHLFDKNIHEISGGELSLCLLARVMCGESDFIFADEPFNHLDIAHQLELLKAIKDFAQKGGGALIIAHDIAMAARLGDEFALMKDGVIIAKGEKESVLSDENLFIAYGAHLSLREIENQSVLIAH